MFDSLNNIKPFQQTRVYIFSADLGKLCSHENSPAIVLLKTIAFWGGVLILQGIEAKDESNSNIPIVYAEKKRNPIRAEIK